MTLRICKTEAESVENIQVEMQHIKERGASSSGTAEVASVFGDVAEIRHGREGLHDVPRLRRSDDSDGSRGRVRGGDLLNRG